MSYETYYDRYKELCDTYKIRHGLYGLIPDRELSTLSILERRGAIEKALDEYDVVVERSRSIYAGVEYTVIRNKPGLSTKDLAIICDKGNLCFGYRACGSTITVYTD